MNHTNKKSPILLLIRSFLRRKTNYENRRHFIIYQRAEGYRREYEPAEAGGNFRTILMLNNNE
jgi:hypothetical protein